MPQIRPEFTACRICSVAAIAVRVEQLIATENILCDLPTRSPCEKREVQLNRRAVSGFISVFFRRSLSVAAGADVPSMKESSRRFACTAHPSGRNVASWRHRPTCRSLLLESSPRVSPIRLFDPHSVWRSPSRKAPHPGCPERDTTGSRFRLSASPHSVRRSSAPPRR